MISLPSAKIFCAIVVITVFNIAVRHASKSRTRSFSSVSDPLFSLQRICFDKGYLNTNFEESSTGQNNLSVELYCVLEQDTIISSCNQTETVVELNPYNKICHNMSPVTTQVTKYCLRGPNIDHGKTTSYAQDISFTYKFFVLCLLKSSEQINTIECNIGHFIVTIFFFDFTHFSFKSVLTLTLDFLIFLLNHFNLILFNEWPPYIQHLGLFTMYGCLVEHVSVLERCMRYRLLLMRNMFRKHDFNSFKRLLFPSKRFTVLFLIAFHCMQVYSYRNPHIDVYRGHVAYHGEIFGYKYSHSFMNKGSSGKSTRNDLYGGGKPLIFSSDELCPYASKDLQEEHYQFLQCVKKDNKQGTDLGDVDNVHCSIPLNILVPKLTLKFARELANLHDMYMPSKILKENALILLENHKCETCPDLLAVFKPYKAASNSEYQQTWYKKNKDNRAKYNKRRAVDPEYKESIRMLSHKRYQSKINEIFPPVPPSAQLCQTIV